MDCSEVGSTSNTKQQHSKKLRKILGFEEYEGAWENKVMPLLSCMKEMHHRLYRKNGEPVLDPLKNNLVFVCSYVSPEFDTDKNDPIFPQSLLSACLDLYSYRDDFELVLVTKMTPNNDKGVFREVMMRFPLSSLIVPFEDFERRIYMCDLVLDPESEQVGFAYKCLFVNIAEKTLFVGQPGTSLPSLLDHLKQLLCSSSFDYHRLFKTMWPLISGSESLSLRPPYYPPISRIFENVKPEYSDAAINDLVSELPPIQIGQKLDVESLLSAGGGGGSNELLLRKHGEQVEPGKAFEGKYTMICCFHAPVFGTDNNSIVFQSLVNTCSELYARGVNFEMVVVIKMKKLADYKQVFDHFLSGFPSSCLVIPFEDSKRRDFIFNYLQLNDDVQCLLLDNNNNILLHGYPEFARYYGADAFPFTDEKLQTLEADEGPEWTTCSTNNLVSLLGCRPSDVLKKTNHDSVMTTISDLNKNDVVGLFLCSKGNLIPKLKEVYEECKIQKKPFEVLLVYIPFHTCLDPQNHKLCVDNLLQKHKLSVWYIVKN